MLVLILAGWINRQQQQMIDYLRAENQVLREKLSGRRLLLNDRQRRLLAVKAKALGRELLEEVASAFTPDTLLRWHRLLVAKKWDFSHLTRKCGRPQIASEVRDLVVHLATENPRWGYDRIRGALAVLGHRISATSAAKILREQGIEPAPQGKRKTTWKTFLKAHWDQLAAIDFTTIEVWSPQGLVTYYLLFAMELASRRVHFAGCTTNPDTVWMKQIARNLTMADEGFLDSKRYVLMDRDATFSEEFRSVLTEAGVQPVRLPPHSPNLNSHLERFHRSLKAECLSRMIFFGEQSLRRATSEFLVHYHRERPHQGLGNRLIEARRPNQPSSGPVRRRERLGGLLNFYYRDAA
jgi:transposase InsO family protein